MNLKFNIECSDTKKKKIRDFVLDHIKPSKIYTAEATYVISDPCDPLDKMEIIYVDNCDAFNDLQAHSLHPYIIIAEITLEYSESEIMKPHNELDSEEDQESTKITGCYGDKGVVSEVINDIGDVSIRAGIKLGELTDSELCDIFSTSAIYLIVKRYTASEIIEMIDNYFNKSEPIEVGDVVTASTSCFLVTYVDNSSVEGISIEDGRVKVYHRDVVTKAKEYDKNKVFKLLYTLVKMDKKHLNGLPMPNPNPEPEEEEEQLQDMDLYNTLPRPAQKMVESLDKELFHRAQKVMKCYVGKTSTKLIPTVIERELLASIKTEREMLMDSYGVDIHPNIYFEDERMNKLYMNIELTKVDEK